MVRTQSGRTNTGNTPRGAVKAKPSAAAATPSGLYSARRTPPASSRTPPLPSSPRLSPPNGGRLVASEPVQTKSTADPFSAYPRSGNLYDSSGAFLSQTGREAAMGPVTRPPGSGGGDYVVFSHSGKHMTRHPAGHAEASDSVAALLHGGGGGGAGLTSTLMGTRRLSLGQGGAGLVDRTEGSSSALTRLPATSAGKTSGRPAHPASGPPTTVTRQNLLLSRKGRRSQEHLAPLRREDLSLDPRKETQRYGVNGLPPATAGIGNTTINNGNGVGGGTSNGTWMERPSVRQRAMDAGASAEDGLGDAYAIGAAAGGGVASASGPRSQPFFSSLRQYTNQRLAQDQQNAAEYEAGVLGSDGNRAFALSGGVGTPSSAAVARSRRLSTGQTNGGGSMGGTNGHNYSLQTSASPSTTAPSLAPAATGGYNAFLSTSRLNYTGGLGTVGAGPAVSSAPRGGGVEDGDDGGAAMAAHRAQMPHQLLTFGSGSPDLEERGSSGSGSSMHRTVHPGDDTDHFFATGEDDEDDYFEDPATEAQLLQQAYDRQSAPVGSRGEAGKDKRKSPSPSTASSAVGKGKSKKANNNNNNSSDAVSPVQPYDFRVVLSSGKTVAKAIQLIAGTGCVQGLRPTMEDEHITKLNLAEVREQPVSVVAILDGHCGRRVADLGGKFLPECICNHSALGENTALAIVESVVQTDQCIYKVCCGPPSPQQKNARGKLMNTQRQDFARSLGGGGMNHDESGGSTLIAAVVHGRMLYVACLGDARAVLYDGRSTMAMSEDHKPNNAKEMKRISQCGGFVQFGRVCGVLAVSRALGDYEFKEQAAAGGGGGGRGVGKLHFRADKELMVSNIADVRQLHLTDESKFLLLACDGLWDVISNEEATQFVRDFLLYTPEVSDPMVISGQKPRPSPAVVERVLNNCCRKLAEFAVSSGSTDNVSATVLFFHDVVDVVATFGAGSASATSTASPASGRRASLFSQSRSPQSARQQQQHDAIDSVLFNTSRGARSGSSGTTTTTTTTLTNGRPARHGNGNPRSGAPPTGLDNFFGGSFGRKSNLGASRGVENTFGGGSRGLW